MLSTSAAPKMICPNPHCGFHGVSAKEKKGSLAALVILLMLGGLPGLIYLVLYNGYLLKCPKCGMKLGETPT